MLKNLYKSGVFLSLICVIVLMCSRSSRAQVPIELIKFEAKYENKKIVIEWETASEINNHVFQIERSLNGEEYETIIEMTLPESEANSTLPKQYKAEDCSPRNGISFYRLKQIDLNGTYEYFDPVVVNCKIKAGFYFNTILFNEKNKSILMDVHNDQKENIHCTIVNYAGQVIMEKDLPCIGGINQFEINNFIVKEGVYLLFLKNKEITIVGKVLTN